MSLQAAFLDKLSAGLRRKRVTNCARWSEEYRMMGGSFPGKWGWTYHPWLYPMHLSDSYTIVGQKSAQMGYTEWALNKTFFKMDVEGLSVLYVLPTERDASDFSASRFDRAVEASPYLSAFFSDVKNVAHKRSASASLYVRGSRSRNQLKSLDTAMIIFDELDEMCQENLALAMARQFGQRVDTQQVLKLSTPTIEDSGINIDFKKSTQHHYFFRCPGCSKHIEFSFPDNIKITGDSDKDPNLKNSYYVCNFCDKQLTSPVPSLNDKKAIARYEWEKSELLKLKHLGGTGEAIATRPQAEIEGYYINQMYSCTILPSMFAASYLRGKRDPTEETEFFNSRMGMTHAVEGSKVSEQNIQKCQQIINYRLSRPDNPDQKRSIRTMGIDVGGVNHVTIEEWYFPNERTPGILINDEAQPKVIYQGTTSGRADDFGELDKLWQAFNVDSAVIDAEPERREAMRFASRHYGRVMLCDWLFNAQGRELIVSESELTIKANRTSWLDLSLGRFRNGLIYLPMDLDQEYIYHICEPQRVYMKDKNGNPVGVYQSAKADHYAFARTYSELALQLATNTAVTQNVKGVY